MLPVRRVVGRRVKSRPLSRSPRSAGERDMWLAGLIWILDDRVLTKSKCGDKLDTSSSVSASTEDEDAYG